MTARTKSEEQVFLLAEARKCYKLASELSAEVTIESDYDRSQALWDRIITAERQADNLMKQYRELCYE